MLSLAFLTALFAVPVPDEYTVLAGGTLNVVPPLLRVTVRRRGHADAATDGRTSGTDEEE